MKTLWYLFLDLLASVVLYLPVVVGAGLVSAIVAAKCQYITGSPAELILAYGWKIYVVIAFASFFIFTGFICRDWNMNIRKVCRGFFMCIGVHIENFFLALFWPLGWCVVIANVMILQVLWTHMVYYAFEYFFVTGLNSPKIETTTSN